MKKAQFLTTPLPQDMVDFWAKFGGLWMEESDRCTAIPAGGNMRRGYRVTPAVIDRGRKIPIHIWDIELHMGGPTVTGAAMHRAEGQ